MVSEEKGKSRSGSVTPRKRSESEQREGASLTPRARELISVLKGTPGPDSPFTLDLLNTLVKEEAGKAAGAEEKVLPWGDFTQRWRYNVKITPSSGAALVKTFEDFQHEWTMDRSATVTRLEEMLRGARATQAGKKDGQHSEHGFALVGKALAEWCRSENASGNPRGTCLGTPCPVRAADGRRCGRPCTVHAISPLAPCLLYTSPSPRDRG